jgi:alanine transaminase
MSKSKDMSNGNTYTRSLNINNINPAVVSAKYAVRGELALRANVLTEQLKNGESDLPFKDVVHCEIGNPQALNQKPLSFIRQVLERLTYFNLGPRVDGVSCFTCG